MLCNFKYTPKQTYNLSLNNYKIDLSKYLFAYLDVYSSHVKIYYNNII